jgi:hypothetical protein
MATIMQGCHALGRLCLVASFVPELLRKMSLDLHCVVQDSADTD